MIKNRLKPDYPLFTTNPTKGAVKCTKVVDKKNPGFHYARFESYAHTPSPL